MELVSRLTQLSAAAETSRAMTSAPDRMFLAPTMSAWSKYPHSSHRNTSRLIRFFLLTWLHSGHLLLVLPGSTGCTFTPESAALYSIYPRNSANAHLLMRSRCFCLNRVRFRMPSRFSMAIPRPVSVAFATSFFAIVWLVFALNRLSRPESAFSLRLAFNGRLPSRFCLVAFRWSDLFTFT